MWGPAEVWPIQPSCTEGLPRAGRRPGPGAAAMTTAHAGPCGADRGAAARTPLRTLLVPGAVPPPLARGLSHLRMCVRLPSAQTVRRRCTHLHSTQTRGQARRCFSRSFKGVCFLSEKRRVWSPPWAAASEGHFGVRSGEAPPSAELPAGLLHPSFCGTGKSGEGRLYVELEGENRREKGWGIFFF